MLLECPKIEQIAIITKKRDATLHGATRCDATHSGGKKGSNVNGNQLAGPPNFYVAGVERIFNEAPRVAKGLKHKLMKINCYLPGGLIIIIAKCPASFCCHLRRQTTRKKKTKKKKKKIPKEKFK